MRPSEAYPDCEEAIEAICLGCEREHGWVYMDEPTTESPPACMVRITGDVEGSVVRFGGVVTCPDQAERMMRESDVYERRMRGDWS